MERVHATGERGGQVSGSLDLKSVMCEYAVQERDKCYGRVCDHGETA